MVKPFVLVFLVTLGLHQLVDQNVSLALNALKMKLVTIKNVWILVLVPVESMQTVKLEIITQYALALKDIQEILS